MKLGPASGVSFSTNEKESRPIRPLDQAQAPSTLYAKDKDARLVKLRIPVDGLTRIDDRLQDSILISQPTTPRRNRISVTTRTSPTPIKSFAGYRDGPERQKRNMKQTKELLINHIEEWQRSINKAT